MPRRLPPPPLRTPHYQVPSSAVKLKADGGLDVGPVPPHLLAQNIHNANSPLFSLPQEIRLEIFGHALGYRLVHVLDNEQWISTEDETDIFSQTHERALLRVCLHIYAESALLPYSLNCFAFICRLDRDNWVANRTYAQLQAVRTIEIQNAYLVDAINGTRMGECHHGCEGRLCSSLLHDASPRILRNSERPAPRLLPFSVLFPKLHKIIVVEDHHNDLSKLIEMAQLAGATDWKAFVKMRERSDVEVVAMTQF